MPDSYEITQAIESAHEAIEELNRTAERIEKAVKDRSGFVPSIAGVAIAYVLLFMLPEHAWHSKWRYAIQYEVDSQKVQVDKEPHDCEFFTAPVGIKYCEYNIEVSTVKWGTSTTGQPIMSSDDGKTWWTFTPDPGVTVPKYATTEQVHAYWVKKDL